MRQITYQYECYKNKNNKNIFVQRESIKTSNSQNTHQISLTSQSLNQKQPQHSLFGGHNHAESEIDQISRIDKQESKKNQPMSIQSTAQWPESTPRDLIDKQPDNQLDTRLDKQQLQHIDPLSSMQDTLTNLTDLTKIRKSFIKEKDLNEVSFQNESKYMFIDNKIDDKQKDILKIKKSQASLFISKESKQPNDSKDQKNLQQSQYIRLSSLRNQPIKVQSFSDALIKKSEPVTQLLKEFPKKVQQIDSENNQQDHDNNQQDSESRQSSEKSRQSSEKSRQSSEKSRSSHNSSDIEQYKNQTLQQIVLLHDELLPELKYENSQISLLLPISDTQQENELNSDWIQIEANEIVNDHNKKTISYNYQTDEDQSELTELTSTVTENTLDGDLIIFNSQFIDQLPNTVNVHYKTD